MTYISDGERQKLVCDIKNYLEEIMPTIPEILLMQLAVLLCQRISDKIEELKKEKK